MKLRITIIFIGIFIITTGILLWNFHLNGFSYLRSADFLAIYYHITEYEKNHGKPPHELEEVIPEYIRKDLFERSLKGVSYKKTNENWDLRECNSKYTRPFYRDRLAASSSSQPHWEKSGMPASR